MDRMFSIKLSQPPTNYIEVWHSPRWETGDQSSSSGSVMTILFPVMGKLLFLSGSQFLHLQSGGRVGSVDQMKVRVKFKARKEALSKLLKCSASTSSSVTWAFNGTNLKGLLLRIK